MKRRARAPTPSFYSSEPAVGGKAIAKKPPVPQQFTANRPPKGTPKHPSRMTGVAGFAGKEQKPRTTKFKPPSQKIPAPMPGPKPPKAAKPKSFKPPVGIKPLKKLKGL